MATYDAPLHHEAFELMEAHRKTIYALVAAHGYEHICSGDRLEFGDHGSITVGMVRRYPSLEELVSAQGWHCLVPSAESAESAIAEVRAIPEWDKELEQAHGVVALRVRDASRK